MMLVTGANGATGSEITRQLAEQERPVRAMVRKLENAEELPKHGVDVVLGDFSDFQSLASAMTTSVLETGTFTGAAGVSAAYDAISEKDVQAAVSAMFKKTPALAAVGDITSVPYLGTVLSQFS